MIFVCVLAHICFIMIASWEGFNLLHDIIIRYPNGYVLCVRVCVVVDVDWIKDRKPIINEYNHINNSRKSEIHTKNLQWLNDKPTNRNYWLHDGIYMHIHTLQKFYERIKHILLRNIVIQNIWYDWPASDRASKHHPNIQSHNSLALGFNIFRLGGGAAYDFIKAVSHRSYTKCTECNFVRLSTSPFDWLYIAVVWFVVCCFCFLLCILH